MTFILTSKLRERQRERDRERERDVGQAIAIVCEREREMWPKPLLSCRVEETPRHEMPYVFCLFR